MSAVNENLSSETEHSKKPDIWGYIIVCIFSLGQAWVLGDALFVEVPIFQITQPEGLAISTVITIAGNATLVTALPLYFIIFKYCNKCINYPILIYSFCVINIISAIITALFWDLTVFNISITIIVIAYVTSVYGNLFTAVLIPYLSTINSAFIPATVSGTNLGSLLTAVVGLIQSPGDPIPLFQPNIYFIIWSIVGIIALVFYIYFEKIYVKQFESEKPQSKESPNDINVKLIVNNKSKNEDLKPKFVLYSVWWKEALKYGLMNSYVQTATWIFIPSLMPYTAVNTTKNDSEMELQYSIELSYLGMCIGSFISMFINVKHDKTFTILLCLYTLLLGIFGWVALDSSGFWVFNGSPIIMVSIVFILRMFDGYLVPSLYKKGSDLYPESSKEITTFISFTSIIIAIFGNIVTILLMYFGVISP